MPSPTVDQQIALAKQRVQQEMPDVADTSVSPMGFLGGLRRGAQAVTSPFTGSVSYNPSALEGQSQDNIDQIMAHELTHSRQAQQMPWYEKATQPLTGLKNSLGDILQGATGSRLGLGYSYGQRPEELEAFQTENDRMLKLGLPGQVRDPGSTFSGTSNYWGDISLPSSVKGLKQAR